MKARFDVTARALEPFNVPAALEAEQEARGRFLEASSAHLAALEAAKLSTIRYNQARAELAAAERYRKRAKRKARKDGPGLELLFPSWFLVSFGLCWAVSLVSLGLFITYGPPEYVGLLFRGLYVAAIACGLGFFAIVGRQALEARREALARARGPLARL